ncbi:thioredoxin family protein [uncultured Sulfitobacter sp.]|uniref:thioredoxin family protein n=1 Tax=uncultured Sulfitobacter sp. TaxID=191468 RepID=UPI002620EBF0|nr:thioredoxin family protein [uncultured Sulfitobacter sp.]
MIIKILGSGCKKCLALEANVKAALSEADVKAEVEKVTDFVDIARYGVMSTPGLVIDEKVVSSGRVLTPPQISALLPTA